MSKLIFVYNADSGLFNLLTDTAHKLLSPETYSCNLCAITYGSFGMKKDWKEFLKSIDIPVEFLHRNELKKKYGISNINLPAILIKEENEPRLWINSESINLCKSIDDLIQLITNKLQSKNFRAKLSLSS
ncbi:MAG: hypothetical protein IIC75_02155 [Bacteroidetes bacterium]|nr:hypothetical protein [Bacteroidota bacterium]